MKRQVLALMFAGLALGAEIALADGWPGSVVGSWSVVGNQSVGTLKVTSQASTGLCRKIGGTIYGNPIEGFYCPFSGRIHFVRKNASDNDSFQVWTGNVSQAGTVNRIGGTFTALNAIGGSLGEYNFHASK